MCPKGEGYEPVIAPGLGIGMILPFLSYTERQCDEMQETLPSVLPAETRDSKRNLLPGGHSARPASPVDVQQFGVRFGCYFCHVQGCYFVSLQLNSSFDIYITRNFMIWTPHQI
jgi:hypothetical protein